MNDGIIKADGTSRLMRAELPATYEEFRAQAAAGTLPMDILFNADGWTQLPTFLNKGALLKDLTAALYGLGSDAVPDDVLAFLGKYNQHCWTKHAYYPQSYELAAESNPCMGWNGHSNNVYYSDSFTVSEKGVVSLTEPISSFSVSGNTATAAKASLDSIKGKYFKSGGNAGASDTSVYFRTDTNSYDSDSYVYAPGKKVQGVAHSYGPEYETVFSPSRNAYPDADSLDGYFYQYVGALFDNVPLFPKIVSGSYIGTGTYGEDNPNSLTFDYQPIMVVFVTDHPNIFVRPCSQVRTWTGSGASGGQVITSWDGNTVSWYADGGYWTGTSSSTGSSEDNRPVYQLNSKGNKYEYVALLAQGGLLT